MDILNFISWIKGGRVVKTVNPSQTLLPVGLKDNRRDDGYLAGAISVTDFITQLNIQPVTTIGLSIWANGFRVVGCIDEDILLPNNATLQYTSPLTMCSGRTLTIPSGTTLTIVP